MKPSRRHRRSRPAHRVVHTHAEQAPLERASQSPRARRRRRLLADSPPESRRASTLPRSDPRPVALPEIRVGRSPRPARARDRRFLRRRLADAHLLASDIRDAVRIARPQEARTQHGASLHEPPGAHCLIERTCNLGRSPNRGQGKQRQANERREHPGHGPILLVRRLHGRMCKKRGNRLTLRTKVVRPPGMSQFLHRLRTRRRRSTHRSRIRARG